MVNVEDLRQGIRIRGLLPQGSVTVKALTPHGDEAAELHPALVYRHEVRLEIERPAVKTRDQPEQKGLFE